VKIPPWALPPRIEEEDETIVWTKALMCWGFLLGTLMVATLGSIALVLGRTEIAVIEAVYALALGTAGLGILRTGKHFQAFSWLGTWSLLVFPALVAWTSGGFLESYGRSIWSFMAPISALVLSQNRLIFLTLLGFVTQTLLLLLVDSPFAPLPGSVATFLTLFHGLGISVVAFGIFYAYHLVVHHQHAILHERDVERDSVRTKEQILAVASHEIRTPLNGILGTLEDLSSEQIPEHMRERFRELQSASGNLMMLINDVLDWSKLQEGAIELESIPFDIQRAIEDVLRAHRAMAHANLVVLSGSWESESSPWTRGDPTRLSQVLTNLVSNAIKFSRSGEVRARGSRHGGELVLVVQDTGIGIPPDRIQNLFQPFAQGDASITRRFGGTGLGLAIVRKIVAIAGGTIEVESLPGKGTAFTARLPWPEAAKPPETSRSELPRPRRILVVDDNALNRKVATRLLQKLGQDVESVEDGPSALDWLETHPCDLVFMDLQMPGMDGFETTSKLLERRPDLPVVALSAEVLEHVRQRTRVVGMVGYLTKPVDLAHFRECLAKWE
jgi:signal transduction histidine kinase/CheY-like chemotaxis protein